MSQIETWKDKLAELAVFGANVQPGQLVAVTSYIGKEDVTRTDRARGLRARREVRRRRLLRPVGEARAGPARGRGHARLRPAVDARTPPLPLRRARRAHLALRPARSARARRPRPGAGRTRPPPLPPGDGRGRQPHDDELEHRPRADALRGPSSSTRSSTARPRTSSSGRTSPTSAGSTRTIRQRRGSERSSELKANAQRLTDRASTPFGSTARAPT